jgi:hypothetical protein
MARVAQQDAENAQNQDSAYAQQSLNNANSEMSAANNDISNLEGNNPYTSKSYQQNQNLLTSAAMNSQDTAAKQQLNNAALQTGTNTAALGRTIASNARAGQRTMNDFNAQTATNNVDKATALQQGLIQDRAGLANTNAGLYSTATGGQDSNINALTNLQGQNEQMWGNVIGGVAGGVGSAFAGKA